MLMTVAKTSANGDSKERELEQYKALLVCRFLLIDSAAALNKGQLLYPGAKFRFVVKRPLARVPL